MPQLPADALVAAQQALHGRQPGDQLVEVRAVLGLEIERALDAQQPRIEQPLGRARRAARRAASSARIARRLDLVARAPHEVQRLGRDVAVRAGDRRRRAPTPRRSTARARRRARAPRRPRARRDPCAGGTSAVHHSCASASAARERVVVGAREPREDRAARRSARAGSAAISSSIQRGSSVDRLARRRARAATTGVSMPGHEVGEVARRHAARAACAPRSSRRSIDALPLGGGPRSRRAAAARLISASSRLWPRRSCDDLDVIDRLVELAGEDQRARRREPRLAVAELAGAVEAGAVRVPRARLVLAADRDQRLDHHHRVFVVGDPAARRARRSRARGRRGGSPPTRTRARAGRRRSSSARCACAPTRTPPSSAASSGSCASASSASSIASAIRPTSRCANAISSAA